MRLEWWSSARIRMGDKSEMMLFDFVCVEDATLGFLCLPVSAVVVGQRGCYYLDVATTAQL